MPENFNVDRLNRDTNTREVAVRVRDGTVQDDPGDVADLLTDADLGGDSDLFDRWSGPTLFAYPVDPDADSDTDADANADTAGDGGASR
jgi:hypothetical protein